jgi:hypothetical protein
MVYLYDLLEKLLENGQFTVDGESLVLKCIFIKNNEFRKVWKAEFELCNRKSIETQGYLICTSGRSTRVLIRLPSVLMFFLFCIIVKHKNTFPVVTLWNPGEK